MKQYCEFQNIPYKNYDGSVCLAEFDDLEQCFGLKINVYTLVPKTDKTSKIVARVGETVRL